ncbi:MAG TPA: protein-methionine-sulfoxide reductase catalytic subunit MsrP [Steroidobacteraceae bacterium]|nr:protein-methionine-sulfoxide reductase catalytic subunit MsrP [Steroidobacteraceae bacterium]
MLLRRPAAIRPSEITPPEVYAGRRRFLGGALALAAATAAPAALGTTGPTGTALSFRRNADLSTSEAANSWEDVTGYNNYYEFGTDKADPAANAGRLRVQPWSVAIGGECEAKGSVPLEELLKPHALEERVYRLRCVEAWSMVIPWVGVPLGEVLKRFRPTSKARYVAFTTLRDPAQMPGQRWPVLDWPYAEGLRIDEAMHPLALLAVGLYGRVLPNQNGAPLRLVVPWKYGFKSIKAIVRIDFTERMPATSWNRAAPGEYGFYANVNPAVDHPRWSQKTERRIGAGVFAPRQPTQPFNGYAREVADLYRGMDLGRNF